MRTTKKKMLDCAPPECVRGTARLVAPNTLRYDLSDGSYCIQLHRTVILRFYPNGRIRLDSGKWKTITTKERMNRFLPNYSISQHRGLWYISDGSWEKRIPYVDGIILEPGKPLPVSDNSREENLLRQITAYCRKLSKHITEHGLPKPSSGDCFCCQMLDVETGKPIPGRDHLVSHLEEGYIMGSLIVNAIRDRGYGNADFVISMRYNHQDCRTEVVRDVRRYLKKQLGLCA